MNVQARWHRWTRFERPSLSAGGVVRVLAGYKPDLNPVTLNARETAKCMKVELPSGLVMTLKIYDRLGVRQTQVRKWVRSKTSNPFFIEFNIPPKG